MKIHEYQAKELFRQYSIPVPEGTVALSVDEAVEAACGLNGYPVVVKAQIHAGGRGKGGGVKLAGSETEARQHADAILGMTLITPQTGAEGQLVQRLLVEAGQNIKEELYLSLLVDRETASVIIMCCREGGMDIEELAEMNPEKIITVNVSPSLGVQGYHLRELIFGLGLPKEVRKEFSELVSKLFTLFVECDCSLVEINPLILTADDRVIALDAKVDLDSNGLFRHPTLLNYRDTAEEDPLEVEASVHNLNYINLDGNVGNIVNGAGLAMATMDIIKQAGAEPANFMDVGGGATAEMVENGLRIILRDQKVKAVLINIFGGILRCDVFAEGVVKAATAIGLNVPVVVRMEGTNVEEGKRILNESGLNLITAVDLQDAAAKIAEAVN
ncbi:ADP-forming succinate--CoA ligase subunit beta [Desulfosediminicola flagellatus]|uniref:ADP-forming succinate--CoA ligase subunit beta n=1 Tax=Desulfosediminicola flagellatus TaxID=2569541 RepID=UPI0010AD4686|nr:ADP-forming succinate--CoA ligase subunit beta [Desulfosediminicola flagellatus]